MHKQSFVTILVLFSIVFFQACSSSQNESVGSTDDISGVWIVTQKNITGQINDDDVLGPLNNKFNNWINTGKIEMSFVPRTSETGVYKENIYLKSGDDYRYDKTNEGYYRIENSNTLLIGITTVDFMGGEWQYQPSISIKGNVLYMKQTLDKTDLEFLWKIYGDGNRVFFNDDKAELITYAVRQ